MPLTLILASPGSPCRHLAHSRRILCLSSASRTHYPTSIALYRVGPYQPKCFLRICANVLARAASPCHSKATSPFGTAVLSHEHGALVIPHSKHYLSTKYLLRREAELSSVADEESEGSDEIAPACSYEPRAPSPYQSPSCIHFTPLRSRRQQTRSAIKAHRESQPTLILDVIHGRVQKLYSKEPRRKHDNFSTRFHRQNIRSSQKHPESQPSIYGLPPGRTAVSLHTILTRYIETTSIAPCGRLEFKFTNEELEVLKAKGHSSQSVEQWASCLLTRDSYAAATIFKPGNETPPLFLLLLFLRRTHIKTFALGIVMKHIKYRLQSGNLDWKCLQILVIRLLRHARRKWPESMPWIAAIFTQQTARIYGEAQSADRLSSTKVSGITHFCNRFLYLVSLPASLYPVRSSTHQEKAQFQVLRFMAGCTPALIVTKVGFRAVTRVQLAHEKTDQERDWASLKTLSWPPWKENRTAMDEEKGPDYGFSRASRILMRMYEAGYKSDGWEELADIYTGWDTDRSPTIQTRIALPAPLHYTRNRLQSMQWAGRVRTTRTRREAWACFLAYEASASLPHQDVYWAMFEKLFYPEVAAQSGSRDALNGPQMQTILKLQPGDMKEVASEPISPQDIVYVGEPVPSYEQLYYRMTEKGVRPTNRFLAFLIETSPEFSITMRLLDSVRHDYNNGIQRLLDGSQLDDITIQKIPGYLFAAFIRFLCRFGELTQIPSLTALSLTLAEHKDRFETDRTYLLEYAYALLIRYQPQYRPAWTAYMERLLYRRNISRSYKRTHPVAVQVYKALYHLITKMQEGDLDLDAEQFQLLCTALQHAAHSALRPANHNHEARQILMTGSWQIRKLFYVLTSANSAPVDPNVSSESIKTEIPAHVPGPTVLYAYVRALAILHDYEGIYSLSSWMTNLHVEVTARANAQHSGPISLRRTIIAIAASLERPEVGSGPEKELVELVKKQVQSVEEWGGWPSTEEMEMCKGNKLYAKRC
ncbi:hypothetical protein K469DRAFT_676646 [Zopfia rhizophila CBS 207.26]|uniref:Uncharacterized protein n=1 Tax=Zopfia rhizophila CBS 207.26 TaxID=1314779 RepID=A0A6A6DHQ6_9PEZI|nr:hypothetical protein K469DRAFT_676646 [Zopfia rhizophila CBS 207.26]